MFQFLTRSLTSRKDDPSAMSVALWLSSFFALQTRPDNLLLCRRAFCFATPELTVERYAIRWPALSRNSYESRRENRHENRCKIGPGSGSGHPKSTQNRSREPLGTPRGHQERPDGVSGASRERLGASSARPGSVRRLSKGAPECQKGRPGASGSAPRRPKSTPSPVRE